MKLLMTADTVGGVWVYALELIRALAEHGVQVALATMGAPLTDQQYREAEGIAGLELHPSSYRLEWMSDPWEDVRRSGEWLLRLEERVRPDLVHLNGYAHGSLPWSAPTLVVGHSCVLSWWEAVKGEPAPGEWSRYREEVARGLAAAGMVAAPTRAMLEALARCYGDCGGSVRQGRVIPNGRDAAGFWPAARQPLILAAGRLWDEAKNCAALAEVAPRLPWPVCVAGDDCHPDAGRVHHENVRLLGRLSTAGVAEWMRRAPIYALPARYEPFGLSALEAGLSGCALVLGDIPSLREVWGDAALFVPPGEPAALQAALQSLIEDPAAREEMGERARARALEYSPARMAAGYLAAYRAQLSRERLGTAVAGSAASEADREEEPACAS